MTAEKGQPMRMQLALQGERPELNTIVVLAIEQGVMEAVTVVNGPPPSANDGAPRKPRSRSRSRSTRRSRYPSVDWPHGTRVKVARRNAVYPHVAPIGRQGTVVRSEAHGRGYTTTVRWDSEPEREYEVGSAMLKRATT